jgi:hypothetical protein
VIAPKDQPNRGTTLLVGEERRRSQRVMVRVPVTLLVKAGGQDLRISARTVEVNIHGALVISPRSFDAETQMELENGRTNETVVCRVTRAPRESSEGFLIPLEFISPSSNFWQITFPPANWKGPEN